MPATEDWTVPSRSVSPETSEDGIGIDGDMDDSNSDEVMEENDSEDDKNSFP
ncbi:hypothetical protein J3E68DRAFT_427092 [Trichoderma sp. SZMC 28012]